MRVLLVSPLPEIDPWCGDVAYTQALLAHPPEGVHYSTYDDALKSGALRERGRRAALREGGMREMPLLLVERVVNALRRRGVLFREPFRTFVVDGDAYDVVHAHVFSVRWQFRGPRPGLVTSNAIPLEELYRRARGWSSRRVRATALADRVLARAQGVEHTSYTLRATDCAVGFSPQMVSWWTDRWGFRGPTEVAPPFLSTELPQKQLGPAPRRLGFIAGDFEAKGGADVLEVFDRLAASRDELELIVVGSPVQEDYVERHAGRVTWLPWVPRKQLLDEVLPAIDLLLYPTKFDGLPLTVVEALSAGIPVVTSDYFAMPSLTEMGAGVAAPEGDVIALERAVLGLLDPETFEQSSRGARALADARFSHASASAALLDAYRAAAAARGRSS